MRNMSFFGREAKKMVEAGSELVRRRRTLPRDGGLGVEGSEYNFKRGNSHTNQISALENVRSLESTWSPCRTVNCLYVVVRWRRGHFRRSLVIIICRVVDASVCSFFLWYELMLYDR
jgi:hypothetical protein